LFFWDSINLYEIFIFLIVAIAGFLTQLFMAQSLKIGEITLIMPIQFNKLIWLSIIGFIFFNEIPDIWVWIGAIMIFISIVYITYRETINKKSFIKSEKVDKLLSNY
jgi:drug/metabolite transporter (DMT)-like permease